MIAPLSPQVDYLSNYEKFTSMALILVTMFYIWMDVLMLYYQNTLSDMQAA